MNVLQHFRKEEHPFAERVQEWTEKASVRHQPRLTDFLDPRQQYIAQAIVQQHPDMCITFWGGFDQAERRRGYIAPEYITAQTEDFKLTLLSLADSGTERIQHGDILGSLMGLGIRREKFGDILVSHKSPQIVLCEDISSYVLLNLNKVGKEAVHCQSVSWSELRFPTDEWAAYQSTVSSLRADVILSDLLRLSRAKSVQLIKAGRVKVNWTALDQPAMSLEPGDVLSVKGFGRFKFINVEGLTKKDKYRVHLAQRKSII
jgi:RNA-binding protein YlmH